MKSAQLCLNRDMKVKVRVDQVELGNIGNLMTSLVRCTISCLHWKWYVV